MKKAVAIFSLLKNKYLLSVTAFALLMLFFDRNDVFTQMERKKQLKELQASKQFYVEEIEKTKKELAELQNNPAALEKYARENYYMKRDNEDVYIVETPDSKKK
ncbi:Cell division protein FtsB [Filimonas lacunae]|uniref:Cell division protein FtsB n=1 Tax=Filimonas lacunae TaxID=477680 RepID=A0A173MQX2_9BACT|nr:septum formation initiator family protein [Filimonas lacunae]BAV10054.1 cell division protein DivIC (FtsB), stabilizes FtsL against RasP cleavage [Filimonas lacunae]SIS83271.1 Cell division protein FtsB [Filimonas lacunae]